MDSCPLGTNAHIKRKIEPTKGLCLWFADVPEGGLTADTYLSGGVSEKGSEFCTEWHFHPNTTEHFVVTGGEACFELEGQDAKTVGKDGHFIIPRGVIHKVSSPERMYTAFKVRGDHDPVAERDFLIEMFTLIETNQFGLLKKYTCWYKSGNFVPAGFSLFPKIFGQISVWLLGGVLGTLLGLGKADSKED